MIPLIDCGEFMGIFSQSTRSYIKSAKLYYEP